jgi:hypothetical protein
MKARRTLVLGFALLIAGTARSGHELPVYPSYYPHEIEIRTVAPAEAAALLRTGELHAYVGPIPTPGTTSPKPLDTVESLGSLVVVRITEDSRLAQDDAAACAAIDAVVRDTAAAGDTAGFVFHPYPVTPWHGDYLHHADRADAAPQRSRASGTSPPDIRVAADPSVQDLVRPERRADGSRVDAVVQAIDVAGLVAAETVALNGWLGPPWIRSGWFHAWRALGGALREPEKQAVQAAVARLQAADDLTAVERINLERELVQALAASCRARMAGYTVKREHFNAEFSAGIENLSFDALEGLDSPMFLRTVKLKDYPWNGTLRLGVAAPPAAAWNPVAGFTDPFGRLARHAIADPAAIPSPYEAGWILNRMSEVEVAPRR